MMVDTWAKRVPLIKVKMKVANTWKMKNLLTAGSGDKRTAGTRGWGERCGAAQRASAALLELLWGQLTSHAALPFFPSTPPSHPAALCPPAQAPITPCPPRAMPTRPEIHLADADGSRESVHQVEDGRQDGQEDGQDQGRQDAHQDGGDKGNAGDDAEAWRAGVGEGLRGGEDALNWR